MSEFNVFFDSPATRPFQAYRSALELEIGARLLDGPPRHGRAG